MHKSQHILSLTQITKWEYYYDEAPPLEIPLSIPDPVWRNGIDRLNSVLQEHQVEAKSLIKKLCGSTRSLLTVAGNQLTALVFLALPAHIS